MTRSIRIVSTHLAMLVLGLTIGYPAGRLLTVGHLYSAQSEREARQVKPFLEGRRPAYDRVAVEWSSNGPIYFQGTVASDEDRRRLVAEVQRLFGEERAQTSVEVAVEAASTPATTAAGR